LNPLGLKKDSRFWVVIRFLQFVLLFVGERLLVRG
jgi:hypothetical protein